MGEVCSRPRAKLEGVGGTKYILWAIFLFLLYALKHFLGTTKFDGAQEEFGLTLPRYTPVSAALVCSDSLRCH